MPRFPKLEGLLAATHTPLNPDGTLRLDAVAGQARHLLAHGLTAAFICGSTGESSSLAVDERLAMTREWSQVVRGTPLKLIVHVGHNSLPEAQRLAEDAQRQGAHAIAALAPNYFRPAGVAELVDFCAAIAERAPALPFYFYDIPALTNVHLPMDEFLSRGRERIPTLAGLKFTNPDDAQLQLCLRHSGGEFDILYGNDEYLLAALALGVRGAVGSTYNFAAPLYQRLIAAFDRGDLATARDLQVQSVQLVKLCVGFTFLRAAKAIMSFLGVDCGPVRLPLRALAPDQIAELRRRLEAAGFFDWILV
jgi:N-acetylneuraminate lyase